MKPNGVVLLLALASGLLLEGCAPKLPEPVTEAEPTATMEFPGSLSETPVAEGNWRGHQLASCAGDPDVPMKVERLLGICSEYFREGSGSDGMIELEMALEEGVRHSLIDLTLGQLYLLAGQGEPALLPVEGPAADVGNWKRNQARLLGRAHLLLERAAKERTDDAVVDYLLADVSRASGDQATAGEYQAAGLNKCTTGRAIGILRLYQQLNRYPAKYLGGASPEYPAGALAREISGDVTLDLLLDPTGKVRQVETVSSPAASLAAAAAVSLKKGSFEPSRVGKYPVWSWLRVTIAFNLDS